MKGIFDILKKWHFEIFQTTLPSRASCLCLTIFVGKGCKDQQTNDAGDFECPIWASNGDCDTKSILNMCKKSCGLCGTGNTYTFDYNESWFTFLKAHQK